MTTKIDQGWLDLPPGDHGPDCGMCEGGNYQTDEGVPCMCPAEYAASLRARVERAEKEARDLYHAGDELNTLYEEQKERADAAEKMLQQHRLNPPCPLACGGHLTGVGYPLDQPGKVLVKCCKCSDFPDLYLDHEKWLAVANREDPT
jgi:hypothetical protein